MVVSKALLPRKKGGIWGEVSWDSHEKALLKHQTPMTFFLVPPKQVATWHPKTGMFFFHSERAVTLCKTKSSIFALWKLCGPFFSISPPICCPQIFGETSFIWPQPLKLTFHGSEKQGVTTAHVGTWHGSRRKSHTQDEFHWRCRFGVSFGVSFVDGIWWLVVGFMRFFFQPKKTFIK